ncbi:MULTISPECIES: helix-turn-helix transcriptional regulator [unclassified Streptomyces]|uniref:helix-turn-helix domain-containing protein n=1 Tax=unclassified Streptomyces TaxID=2593676 RepID=UPI002255998D|nr:MULTISPECIES: helix-turn-helix transcriptional regulator [unclassified Streptomyces]MCX5056025.1 helix-turn-helix transcriptional regulator [Streptomyces sp. NBC_00452]MCX5287129.1 helix-turn-helix transcriptional regulator [Streptomyces sp. NBC_00183]MCX5421858.1 helix-turn-helix transcriptional regulator [Streptomyces sp. NBC_00078]
MRNPTGRQLRFGAELRKLRERAGLSSTEAGQLLGIKQAQVSNMEAGRVGVSPERVRTIACHYDCSDKALIEALSEMTSERTRGWWEQYRELLPDALPDLAELEHHAQSLRDATTARIPGLLQTREYALEIFRQAVTELSPPDIEHRLSFRIKRQAVLFREEDPTPYEAIVHEAALRMKVGGPTAARQQLKHLLDMSERDHITLRAITFEAGAYPGSGQSIHYAHGPVPQLDTVYLDQAHGLAFLDAEAQLHKYRTLFDRIDAVSLSPEETRSLIGNLMREL